VLTGIIRHFALLALVVPVPGHAWSEYRSTNFAIITDMRPAAAEDLLRDFERFRIAALAVTGLPLRPENTRMQIVLFARAGEFDPLRPQRETAAFYADTLAGPRMVIGAARSPRQTRPYLFHEYMHYLLRERSDLQYPMWYDEGFAELLASAEVRRGDVRIGRMDMQHHVSWLRHNSVLPVAVLLNPPPPRRRDDDTAFYASAWLFTHFLQLGAQRDKRDLKPLVREYLRRFDANQDPVALFEDIFSMDVAEMDAQLRAYQQRARYSVLTVNVPAYGSEITRTRLPEPERAFVLGDLAFQLGHHSVAAGYVSGIVASDAESARALSLRAVLAHPDDSAASRAMIESAITAAPDDARVLSNAARVYYHDYERLRESGVVDRPILARSIDHGLRAKAFDPESLEPNEYLWAAYAALGESVEAVRWMMDAFQLNPTSVRLNCIIGVYLALIDEPAHARSFLQRVLTWSHDYELRGRVTALLDGTVRGRSPAAICAP
jgi:tetratricopeptide (TPR) repeat protein